MQQGVLLFLLSWTSFDVREDLDVGKSGLEDVSRVGYGTSRRLDLVDSGGRATAHSTTALGQRRDRLASMRYDRALREQRDQAPLREILLDVDREVKHFPGGSPGRPA